MSVHHLADAAQALPILAKKKGQRKYDLFSSWTYLSMYNRQRMKKCTVVARNFVRNMPPPRLRSSTRRKGRKLTLLYVPTWRSSEGGEFTQHRPLVQNFAGVAPLPVASAAAPVRAPRPGRRARAPDLRCRGPGHGPRPATLFLARPRCFFSGPVLPLRTRLGCGGCGILGICSGVNIRRSRDESQGKVSGVEVVCRNTSAKKNRVNACY